MKHLSLLLITLTFFSCKSLEINKNTVQKKQYKQNGYVIFEKLEIIPRQKIHIAKDEAGVSYIKLLPGEKTVFRYMYKKKPEDQNLMDAMYMENLVFEISGKIKNTRWKNENLKSVNLTAQISGFRNSRLLTIERGSLRIKVIDKHNLEVEINIDDAYKGIQKKHIKQLVQIQ